MLREKAQETREVPKESKKAKLEKSNKCAHEGVKIGGCDLVAWPLSASSFSPLNYFLENMDIHKVTMFILFFSHHSIRNRGA